MITKADYEATDAMMESAVPEINPMASLSGCPMSRRSAIGSGLTGLTGLQALFLSGAFGTGCKTRPNTSETLDAADQSTQTPFLTAYDNVEKQVTDIPSQIKARIGTVATWLRVNPDQFWHELREFRPILAVPAFFTFCSQHHHSFRILNRYHYDYAAKDFDLSKPNNAFLVAHNSEQMDAMGGKPTSILGQAITKLHDPDREVGLLTIRVGDRVEKTQSLMFDAVEKILARYRGQNAGEIDIIADLARLIPLEVGRIFMGVPSGNGAGLQVSDDDKFMVVEYDYDKQYDQRPTKVVSTREAFKDEASAALPANGEFVKVSEDDLRGWITYLFQSWFLNVNDRDPRIRQRGLVAGHRLSGYVYFLMKKLRQDYSDKKKLAMFVNGAEPIDMLRRALWHYERNTSFEVRYGDNVETFRFKDHLLQHYIDNEQMFTDAGMTRENYINQRLSGIVAQIGGSVVNVIDAVGNCMEVLMRPEHVVQLRAAEDAAKGWTQKIKNNKTADVTAERELIYQTMIECARFKPQPRCRPAIATLAR